MCYRTDVRAGLCSAKEVPYSVEAALSLRPGPACACSVAITPSSKVASGRRLLRLVGGLHEAAVVAQESTADRLLPGWTPQLMSTVSDPASGARRSRRGYYYQDLYTMWCCLRMLHGEWDEVLPEGEEDVTCRRSIPPLHRQVQVKTLENPPSLWSPARLCNPEIRDRLDTSILGRLFTNKDLSDETILVLVLNEGVSRDLLPLKVGQNLDRSGIELDLARRLDGLAPSSGRTVGWCVQRLEIEEFEATAEGVEGRIFRSLSTACQSLGRALLPDEIEQLLSDLMQTVQAAARALEAVAITRTEFELMLTRRAEELMHSTNELQGDLAPTLDQKLRRAQLNDEQVERCQRMRAAFNRRRRSAVGQMGAALDDLATEVFMACSSAAARRHAGQIAPGAELYAETVRAVSDVHRIGGWSGRQLALADAYGALHDITARCQHRYD
jgi:hypothetical protein